MPTTLVCDTFPLPPDAVEQLWQATIRRRQFGDETVAIRCVDAAEIQKLNQQYRQKDAPTNILTFSYGADPVLPESGPHHDVSLCLPVAKQEAGERHVELPSYVALLLAHAFLHITGLDHEKSSDEAAVTHKFEQEILEAQGFHPAVL